MFSCRYIVLLIYLLVELVFFLYILLYVTVVVQPLREEQQKYVFRSPMDSVKEACLMLTRIECYGLKDWLYLLFLEADIEEIHEINLDSAITWCVFSKEFQDLSEEEANEVRLFHSSLLTR